MYLHLCLIVSYLINIGFANDDFNVTLEYLQAIPRRDCYVYSKNDCPYQNVQYFYYTERSEEQIWITPNGNNLDETFFNPLFETKIIIHGYSGNRFLGALDYIKNEYLKRSDLNIIMVDWETLAQGPCYPAAVQNCKITGKCVSELVETIQKISNARIHIVGFSLGAHVAGFISKYLSVKVIDRITGLDPALPGFSWVPKDSKLDKSDAEFVDIIHTNAFLEGTPELLGHIDFFLNGGIFQPGCDNKNILSCSHHRSPLVFGESINSVDGFWGWPCKSYFNYLFGLCLKPYNEILMGEFVNQEKRGMYVLLTNDSPPFAKGLFNNKQGRARNITERVLLYYILIVYEKMLMDAINYRIIKKIN